LVFGIPKNTEYWQLNSKKSVQFGIIYTHLYFQSLAKLMKKNNSKQKKQNKNLLKPTEEKKEKNFL